MPNIIDANGLQTASQAELLATFTAALQAIYGVDINLDPDSPDGEWVMEIVQTTLDQQEFIALVNAGFDPDQAVGVILDQRCAINGIQRQAGTFTTTDITLVASAALNLFGLDQTDQPVYTVADAAGNQWQLMTTQTISAPGTFVYIFQAANPGAVLTVPNTITIPVSVVLGITSINNPTAALTTGVNEESDALLKIRRQKSVSIGSQGYLSGLLAALSNVPGVTNAFVYENNTGSTDANGVPGHSIWVIVSGSPANADVANAIYVKRNAGCGMFGQTSFGVVQVDGSTFNVLWDFVTSQPLFMTFTLASLNSLAGSASPTPPNIAAIRSGLVTAFVPAVAAQVNSNEVAAFVQGIDPNSLVSGTGFSIETVQTITLSGVAASGTFKFSYGTQSTAAINWNDTSQIQTKLRALTGLAAVVVTGSIASQTLVITMTGVTNPSMIGVNSNSLVTSVPAAITFGFFSTFTTTLTPATKNLQFAVSSPNIIILPMILSAPGVGYVFSSGKVSHSTATVVHSATLQFTGLGGYGAYVYSVSSGTGGSIDASSGLYTAGSAGSDTVTVVDALGNSTTCVVTVT